ncbi:tRNA 2-thiocytidine biosynthesis TtcA family protein [[Clostridium] innocuum]|uniref:tRNA 2-thiocytidine biosynthesis TtcA family protein n=1 Tax=Bacillota TaxID=1239 RepID=UPI001C392999|nr:MULTISPECIES: tRNA 2-thiocytidine biosynthesis TtcA family protein [Thomasclavelia]MBV4342844.1 tRNA 2-thiocytidine biosynthesis TtcA family protein [Erysipelatoclostridium sp. DFI.2.3]MCC2791741.1 tRNA 2-thiocytidine biosynthesis TtcA family protein [[Clostridium] innocuum]MCC2799848.1 tRNA 2-thiocytidine biosynthesis TtcA family protein [[Clostridium] innocuum]MCC2806038.1 tRNA 2-thiocytidine biosynthesis TtcA family protein [[Clostridium] innocuum]MCC2810260.1 tRNA 2-thiocytidine biosynt
MELHTILGDIRKADQDYHLIDDGDRIAVGVSGGKDSMVLLTALHMYSKFADRNFEVIGIHIKLGFPNMDFSEVVAFCRQQGITFYQYDSQVYEILKRNPDKEGNIKCSLCSKFKKATVIDAAKKLNCTKVAFGHHSDDAVETLLMNAIHGGKLATFLPKMYMSRTDTTFIRPLVYSYESDILSALERNQIPFVKSTCPNDGYTERQAMKDMLQEFYRSYPMAQKNFIRMLYNEDQVELWHREGDHRAEKAKSMSVLLKEEGDLQLTRHGANYFIVYSHSDTPKQRCHLKIREEESKAIMDGTAIKEIFQTYSSTKDI